MTAFTEATKFFHACESLKGTKGTEEFLAETATFSSQAEPVGEIQSLREYADWLAAVGNTALVGASYELHSSAWDEDSRTALFFGTFLGTHTGEGGPVPATGKSTASHYVYCVKMDDNNKVSHVTKIWNAGWSMRELGWG